jgi:hypothetical protein
VGAVHVPALHTSPAQHGALTEHAAPTVRHDCGYSQDPPRQLRPGQHVCPLPHVSFHVRQVAESGSQSFEVALHVPLQQSAEERHRPYDPEQFCPPARHAPRTQLLPVAQSALSTQRAPGWPEPDAPHTPLVHAAPPQQSAELVQVPVALTQAVRHLVAVPETAPQTGEDSQQPPWPKPDVHVASAQPVAFAASQRPRRHMSPSQQSVSAPHELPSPPHTPRQTLPARFPVAVQYGASAQHPPCANPCVQIEYAQKGYRSQV